MGLDFHEGLKKSTWNICRFLYYVGLPKGSDNAMWVMGLGSGCDILVWKKNRLHIFCWLI